MKNLLFKKKIIIGSANFTQKYGAEKIKIRAHEIKKILNSAEKNCIDEIDTAEAYLKNKTIFKNIKNKFRFSSKVLPDSKWHSLEFCERKLIKHFNNLNTDKIETLLFHDTKILYSYNAFKIFKNLEVLKKKKYFKKIGISVYDTKSLNYIVNNFDIDVVQCPYNILDKRILNTGWFDKLKYRGIEVHVRSIFLQGLLVNKLVYQNRYFKKWQKKFIIGFYLLRKMIFLQSLSVFQMYQIMTLTK